MDDTTHHNTADPAQLIRAEQTWHSFTKWAKVGTAVIIAGVIVLAVITLRFP